MHVAAVFTRFGPYHIARLEAAGRHFAAHGGQVTGIETTRTGAVYAWAPVEGGDRFNKVTLFENRVYESLARNQIAAALRDQLDTLSPDVVAIPGWRCAEALTALGWATDRGRAVVLMSESARIDAVRHVIGETIKRRIVRQCAAALVGGQRHMAYLQELGMNTERVALGYDTVDNRHFTRGADQARQEAHAKHTALHLPAHYFLASCRFVPKKNLARVLEAYARYRNTVGSAAWDLVLCGDGPLRSDLEAKTKALNLASHVHFPGFIDYAEMPAYYGLAGAFIQASTVEQWGLVVNEAAACGLPLLVSTPTGAITELLREGENGFGFDPYNIAALTTLLTRLAHGECDLASMGRCSREIVSHWDTDRFGAGLFEAAGIAMKTRTPSRSLLDRAITRILMYH